MVGFLSQKKFEGHDAYVVLALSYSADVVGKQNADMPPKTL